MRYILRAACGFLALGMPLSGLCAEPASEKRPNIIFILTDDQGYGDLERHGHPLLKTPHTNRLYDESVRFDNFYWKPHQVDNLTAHIDLLPTLCEIAGVQVPEALRSELDGFSLVPLLEAEQPLSWHDDRYLFHHVARWPSGLAASHKYAMCGIRQGNYPDMVARGGDQGLTSLSQYGAAYEAKTKAAQKEE